jgi:hypothetical protein
MNPDGIYGRMTTRSKIEATRLMINQSLSHIRRLRANLHVSNLLARRGTELSSEGFSTLRETPTGKSSRR